MLRSLLNILFHVYRTQKVLKFTSGFHLLVLQFTKNKSVQINFPGTIYMIFFYRFCSFPTVVCQCVSTISHELPSLPNYGSNTVQKIWTQLNLSCMRPGVVKLIFCLCERVKQNQSSNFLGRLCKRWMAVNIGE